VEDLAPVLLLNTLVGRLTDNLNKVAGTGYSLKWTA
jgi:hypothetical protein